VRTFRFAFALLLALAAVPAVRADDASAPPAAGDAHRQIEAVLAAYGGRAALAKVTAYRCDGRVAALMHPREGPTTRLFHRPDQLRVELRYAVKPETRIVDGTHGWRGDGDDVEPATGAMLDAMVLQAARAGVPWTLMERADSAHVIAALDDSSGALPGLELSLGDGRTLRVYVDPATHLVRHSVSLLDRGDMHTTFETVYDDYRKVGGVVFAFREQNWASGAHTADTQFEKVTLNPKLPPDAFAPKHPKRTDT
jgi:hypothetical protein